MQRIATATKAVDKFGAGKDGFTNGNAVSGIPATDLDEAWFDSVQEEIVGVIAAAGITLDVANRAQLLTALRSAGVFQTPTTGDRSTKAATTQMFANEFGSSFAGSGYQKLPSGLIIQWGNTTPSAINTAAQITYPIAFPNATLSASLMPTNVASTSATAWRVNAPTPTGFLFAASTAGSSSVFWIAIGY